MDRDKQIEQAFLTWLDGKDIDPERFLGTDDAQIDGQPVTKDEFEQCVRRLQNAGLIDGVRSHGPGLTRVRLTSEGRLAASRLRR